MAAVGEPFPVSGSGWPCRRAVGPRPAPRPQQPGAAPSRAGPSGAGLSRSAPRRAAPWGCWSGCGRSGSSSASRWSSLWRGWSPASASKAVSADAVPRSPARAPPAPGTSPTPGGRASSRPCGVPALHRLLCFQPLLLSNPGVVPECAPVSLLSAVPAAGGASCSFGIRSDGSQVVTGSERAPVQLSHNFQSCGHQVPAAQVWISAAWELPRRCIVVNSQELGFGQTFSFVLQ